MTKMIQKALMSIRRQFLKVILYEKNFGLFNIYWFHQHYFLSKPDSTAGIQHSKSNFRTIQFNSRDHPLQRSWIPTAEEEPFLRQIWETGPKRVITIMDDHMVLEDLFLIKFCLSQGRRRRGRHGVIFLWWQEGYPAYFQEWLGGLLDQIGERRKGVHVRVHM
jgi:hypothetical protein